MTETFQRYIELLYSHVDQGNTQSLEIRSFSSSSDSKCLDAISFDSQNVALSTLSNGMYDIISIIVFLSALAEKKRDKEAYYRIFGLIRRSQGLFEMWLDGVHGACIMPYAVIDETVSVYVNALHCIAAQKEVEITDEIVFLEQIISDLSECNNQCVDKQPPFLPLNRLGVLTSGKIYSCSKFSLFDFTEDGYKIDYTENTCIVSKEKIESVLFVVTEEKNNYVFETYTNISHSKCEHAIIVTTPILDFEYSDDVLKNLCNPTQLHITTLHISSTCILEFSKQTKVMIQRLAGAPFFLNGEYVIFFEVLKDEEISIKWSEC